MENWQRDMAYMLGLAGAPKPSYDTEGRHAHGVTTAASGAFPEDYMKGIRSAVGVIRASRCETITGVDMDPTGMMRLSALRNGEEIIAMSASAALSCDLAR